MKNYLFQTLRKLFSLMFVLYLFVFVSAFMGFAENVLPDSRTQRNLDNRANTQYRLSSQSNDNITTNSDTVAPKAGNLGANSNKKELNTSKTSDNYTAGLPQNTVDNNLTDGSETKTSSPWKIPGLALLGGALGGVLGSAVMNGYSLNKNNYIGGYSKSSTAGQVPYFVDKSAQGYKEDIKTAADNWNKVADVNFKETKSPQKAAIVFQSKPLGERTVKGNTTVGGYRWTPQKVYEDPTAPEKIVFNSDLAMWDPNKSGYKDNAITRPKTITHELGHALGLGDLYTLENKSNVMFGFTNPNVTQQTITPKQVDAVKTVQATGFSGLVPGSYRLEDMHKPNNLDGSDIVETDGLTPIN